MMFVMMKELVRPDWGNSRPAAADERRSRLQPFTMTMIVGFVRRDGGGAGDRHGVDSLHEARDITLCNDYNVYNHNNDMIMTVRAP